MSNESPQSNNDRLTLTKSLAPVQVWALALGSIIGWGCFVLPGIRFLPQAGPLASCIGFFIGAVLLMFIALCYGKLVENFPVAGGAFTYAYAGFGKVAAFICGWALVLGYLSIIALNGTALALLTRFLLPGVFEWGYMYSIAGWEVYAGELIFISAILLLFGSLNYRGGDIAGGIQLGMIYVLLGGITILAVAAFIAPTADVVNLKPHFAEGKSQIAAIAAIVAIAPWLYIGFDTIPQTAEEFNFPHSKSTSLMLWAIMVGAACYAIVTITVAIVIPYPELLDQNHPWATGAIAELVLGKTGSIVLALAVFAAICTGINGFYMATTRLIFSMARAKFMPQWFANVHPKYNSPSNAILFTMLLCLIAPWFGRKVLDWVVEMSAVGTVIAYLFTCMTAYRFFGSDRTKAGAATGKLYAVLGMLAALLCLGLLTVPGSPAEICTESWYALIGWTLMGVAFYMAKQKSSMR